MNVLLYLGFTKEEGLLASKPETLKSSWFYMTMFYFHIFFGAVALISGVTQFRFTLRKFNSHRMIGKIYVFAVLFSGLGGLYISIYANTGLTAQMGFSMLAIAWLTTTYLAYSAIRNKNIATHQKWIFRSMALTFAAITLRLLIPTVLISGISFEVAYPVIAWACWIPNLIVNEVFVLSKQKKVVMV